MSSSKVQLNKTLYCNDVIELQGEFIFDNEKDIYLQKVNQSYDGPAWMKYDQIEIKFPNNDNQQLDQDIQPLSEFRSKVAFYFDKVKKTKRPLVITQNGKSSAILIDVSEYQSMIDKIEVLEDIKTAEEQISQGLSVSHTNVKKRIAKRFKP